MTNQSTSCAYCDADIKDLIIETHQKFLAESFGPFKVTCNKCGRINRIRIVPITYGYATDKIA